MKLIVGLGNPGSAYAHNRHNIGFRCVNHLSKAYNIPFDHHHSQAQVGTGRIEGVEVALAKPGTYMNASGRSARLLLHRFHAEPRDLVVIQDELDLPPGKIRLYTGGSAGGHKGIDSIISELGSRDFVRIRVGVGRPPAGMDAVDYVLRDFPPDERPIIDEVIVRVAEATVCLLRDGLAAAMNAFN